MHKILFPALNSQSLKQMALNVETNSDWLEDCFDNKKKLKFSSPFPLAEIR